MPSSHSVAAPSAPHIHLVLCRLGAEDVSWAVRAAAASASSKRVQLIVYNGGLPLATSQWAQEVLDRTLVRKLQLAGAHESYCYLEHIQRTLRGAATPGMSSNFAAITIFAPASPRCEGGVGEVCVPRLERALRSFDRERATIEPYGYAPIEPTPVHEFWQGLSQTLVCLPAGYARLSQGRDLHTDAEFMSYSPSGSFAVARRNLISAPRGWLRRAHEAMRNATAMHLQPTRAANVPPPEPVGIDGTNCCAEGNTCIPWMLERMWPMLLGTPHRGCSGVRTGYCANEWAPAQIAKSDKTGVDAPVPSMVPREGAGAIKLRLDVARVARVARFANDLTDDERTQVLELLAAERHPHHRPASAAPATIGEAGAPMCTTQLCAILALLDKARTSDDGDFSLYLASAVNSSEIFVAPERSQKRCRQLFVDKKVAATRSMFFMPPP